ncbi:hypothetical protein [Robertkochia aurantiaca]|uniref:hypothetical protein n=1 Tax=Robertkochia aurantiaca TaxID=2873700 RepID=UPI001CCC2D0B|nr:hypothetical protein [Robertkochia sp. 3YJGBD-33]
MRKKLENELVALAHNILNRKGKQNLDAMQEQARRLYEALTLLRFIEEHFGELPAANGKSEVADRFEILANRVLRGNSEVPEDNPHAHEDDLMTPVMDTIKDMVKEMPEEESLEEILRGILPEQEFMKNDIEFVSPNMASGNSPDVKTRKRSLNDTLNKGFQIGLNDKLAFIKHLFGGNTEDYQRVISQVNTLQNYEAAENFILQMVKPDHENWEGKEEYEIRFLQLIARKFE